MELAFTLTPGLHLFLLDQANGLVNGQTDVSTFYSVTVLTLFGHFPTSFLFGAIMKHYGNSIEVAVTCGSICWLMCAVTSIALLLVHVSVQLPFFFHAVVILGLVIGTLVRVVVVTLLPLSVYNNRDAFLVVLWWWLLVGIDWPAYPVQWGVFLEIMAIICVAQLVQPRSRSTPSISGAALVALTPVMLRWTELSLMRYSLWMIPFMLVFVVVSVCTTGCAMDINRVLDWTLGEYIAVDIDEDDLLEYGESGGTRDLAVPRIVIPGRGAKKGD